MRAAALALAMMLLTAACSTPVAGAGGTDTEYGWVRGQLKSILGAPVEDVERATRRAFSELDLVGVRGGADVFEGKLEARMATGTSVRVLLRALDAGRTVVRIRVGDVGDRAISMQLLRHIQSDLHAPAGPRA